MGLNPTNSNMYEWITDTINPLRGACSHKCKYCYVESLKKRFPVIRNKYSGKIELDNKVIGKKLKSGKFYFVQSMGDLFAENVPFFMIADIMYYCNSFDNQYLFQSKNPGRFNDFLINSKTNILGTTIESNLDYPGMSKAPGIMDRVDAMINLRTAGYRTMLTIEPILEFDIKELSKIIIAVSPEWINIGADSMGHDLPEPSKRKIIELIELLKLYGKIEIRQKKNLKRLLK